MEKVKINSGKASGCRKWEIIQGVRNYCKYTCFLFEPLEIAIGSLFPNAVIFWSRRKSILPPYSNETRLTLQEPCQPQCIVYYIDSFRTTDLENYLSRHQRVAFHGFYIHFVIYHVVLIFPRIALIFCDGKSRELGKAFCNLFLTLHTKITDKCQGRA